MITTKITGLSAQGNDEFSGLAYSNNDVAVTIESSNVAEDGFKYIVEITDATTPYKFYVSPNAALNGVFNCKTIFNQLTPTPMVYNTTDILVHISSPLLSYSLNTMQFRVSIWEGWNIGGVFTEDETDLISYQLMCVYGSGKQNFIVMGTNDTKPLALCQAYDNTLGFNAETVSTAINLPASLQSETINWQKISRSNVSGQEDSAYRILSWIADDGTYLNANYPFFTIDNFLFELYDELGTVISTFSIPFSTGYSSLFHLPTGLKNLVNGGYIDQTTADNTAYWTLVGVDADDNEVTAKYGYWVESDCKYNPVHLYWLNQMGGIDSYSFIKKNEKSIEVEKKRYKQYSGDYNNATTENPFSTQSYSRSLTEREPIVKTFLNLTSNWLTESEFKYMKDLFRSKSVWMVDDNVDGYSVIPVVVEDNNYLMRRERNSRKYNQNIRLQIANDNDFININNTPYPIPEPIACTYADNWASNIGSTTLPLTNTTGSYVEITAIFTTSGRYRVVYPYNADTTPFFVYGNTYYVRLEFSNPIPGAGTGYFRYGDDGLGGYFVTSYNAADTAAPIEFSLVWGYNNYFRLNLPTFVGVYTGVIKVYLGFGTCP